MTIPLVIKLSKCLKGHRFLNRYIERNFMPNNKMSQTRFFKNTMNDSTEINVELSATQIKNQTLNIVTKIEQKFEPSDRHGEDGIYLGTAGVAYMYYHLSKLPTFAKEQEQLLKKSVSYLQSAINATKKKSRLCDVPSFLLGNGGVYVIAAAIYKAIGDAEKQELYVKMYLEAGNICQDTNFLNCGSDELFVGRAGFICGVIWLVKEGVIELPREALHTLCKITVRSGADYSKRRAHRCPLMFSYYDTEYLGAAHGICSILQMLISVPGFLESNPDDAKLIRNSVDYMLSIQDPDGNFPCAMDELGQRPHDLVHWCHGAPGVIYLMAKAFLVWNDPNYLSSCEKSAALIWKAGLLRKGPGICHGVAGNGYAFLLMHRLTGDAHYLHRAKHFAQFLESEAFKKNARTPDAPYSLFEGVSGTACFLADLLQPETAAFPFLDVF